MPMGSNSSFITFIPKVSNHIHIKDYRPISLINIHYKIIAKVLANRLAKVVDKIVSHEQYAFISGRQILDGPLILSEMNDWTSILVNEIPTFKFFVKHGLRQGDPLSPFLFIIDMEGLHMALSDVPHSGLIHALLQKWHWRMNSKANALWVKVVKAFHGQEGGFGLNENSSNVFGSLGLNKIWTASCRIVSKTISGPRTGLVALIGAYHSAYLNDIINEISLTEFSSE
nr:RNA-directed DNA polymerase, eukaryota, reverse transcriptase zinc-binding domain protein [Tanacetum cinerariifolium]